MTQLNFNLNKTDLKIVGAALNFNKNAKIKQQANGTVEEGGKES